MLSHKAHAVLDVVAVVALPVLPRVLGFSRPVRRLFDIIAASTAANSLLTRYRRNTRGLLPMQTHLQICGVHAGVLLAAAALLKDEEPLARTALGQVGLMYLAASLLTDHRPSRSSTAILRPVPYEAMNRSRRPRPHGRDRGAIRGGRLSALEIH